jgi:hypothetical protein
MIKVRILDCCEFCGGETYVFVCEDVDAIGETFERLDTVVLLMNFSQEIDLYQGLMSVGSSLAMAALCDTLV